MAKMSGDNRFFAWRTKTLSGGAESCYAGGVDGKIPPIVALLLINLYYKHHQA
jgi:hypothetical protein